MAGAYTHITLINTASQRKLLEKRDPELLGELARILSAYKHFADAGSLGPDYPYLVKIYPGAKEWADRMHYSLTSGVIKEGIKIIKRMQPGEDKEKCTAWLFGYASHFAADLTIHPVVELHVGRYKDSKENQASHLWCEMNQDVFILPRLDLTVEASEYLESSIKDCGLVFDGTIVNFWNDILKQNYPEEYRKSPPDIRIWHTGYCSILDGSSGPGELKFMGRHLIAAALGQKIYPSLKDVEYKYIENLPTPCGSRIHFNDLFDRAVSNTIDIWVIMAKAIWNNDESYKYKLIDCNLDTGEVAPGEIFFWEKRT